MIYFGYLEEKANVIIFLYCSTSLLHAGVLPLPHSHVLSWSALIFLPDLCPVIPIYSFPPLFAVCPSRLTLSFYAKFANAPFPAFLILFFSPVSEQQEPRGSVTAALIVRGISAPLAVPVLLSCCSYGQAKALAGTHLAPSSLCWLALGSE